METQDISDQILNEIEKEKLRTLAADKIMFEAAKKYVLAVAYTHGVMEKGKPFLGNVNYALQLSWGAASGAGMPRSDEELGQDLRALTKATQMVESGFREIEEMAEKVEALKEDNNPAE